MITYNWSVVALKCKQNENEENEIYEILWRKTGTDEEGIQASFDGVIDAKAIVYPENYKFLPYDKLKESDILKLIKLFVSDSLEQHVDFVIQKQIDHNKNTFGYTALPWMKVRKKSK